MTTFSPHGGAGAGPGGPGPAGGPPVPASTPPAEPTPPRGPGVLAPFPTAPKERNPRMWIGLAVTAAVVLVCCAGSVVGLLGLYTWQVGQVSSTVDTFLTDIEQGRYDQAYQMQCQDVRDRESRNDFRSQFERGPKLTGHHLQPVTTGGDSLATFVVPADLDFDDGSSQREQFRVVPEGNSMTVCGVQA